MFGFDAIAGQPFDGDEETLVYQPVSRIIAGGFSNGRPVQVAVLTIIDYLQWDDDSYILWDDDTPIQWD